ncbi:MAG: glycosyltransferase family 2 protein [Cyclobacteriaceae bacterium]|nr:glycosyltransferase family 2 protein [Cyclobacteriaceae bacterium]
MTQLSVVIPVLNEAGNIAGLTARLQASLKDFSYEIIWVDDGSTDQTVQEITNHLDARTKLICLSRNFGQTAALAAGIDAATGSFIITMDGDQQNNPDDIAPMLRKLQDGNWDVVTGFRKDRKDNIIRTIPSRLANRLIRSISGVTIKDYGCALKIFRSNIAKNLGLYGDLHRFIPILASLQGARITDMAVSHAPRVHGQSKYGLSRTFKVLSDLFLLFFFQKYFRRPIHFFGPLGMVTLLTGAIISLYLLGEKILGHDIGGRPLLILGVSLVLAGIQFLTFGLLAELMMRTYYESQNKKIYTIKEVIVGQQNP